jgi:prolycopene isomerase
MRAVVIGSGIGGTAATMLLQHAGVHTLLLEKNKRVGGSCASYEKRGFRIDFGTHMFSRGPAGPLGEVLRRVGRPSALSFRRTRDIAEIRAFVPGLGLTKIAVPAERHRYLPFVVSLARALRLPPIEAVKAGRMFAHILAMSDEEVELWNDYTVEDFVRGYTDYTATHVLFGFLLGLYFILPYWQVSAGEALWSFRKMVGDNWLSYPLGGASAIPETYATIARSMGAEIVTDMGARKIVVDSGAVRGVELEDGTFVPASIVVSTSSVRTTVLRLVGAEHFPAEYAEKARTIQGSQIAVQAKIALKKPLVDAGALVGGVGEGDFGFFSLKGEDLKVMFGAILEGRIPPVVPFYCPVPSNFDPTLAPPGCQLLTVCALAPTSDVKLSDPGTAWEEAMLRTMRRVVPGIDDQVMFIDRFSVGFIEHWIGKEFGPAVSTGQTPGQVGVNRPSVSTPIRGLYLAGCGAGGRGVGTELAAASAIECTDRILADLQPAATVTALPLARAPSTRDRLVGAFTSVLARSTRAGAIERGS